MHITNLDKPEDIHHIVQQNLRALGVKHRTKKTNKKIQETCRIGNHIFKKPLQAINLHTATLDNGVKLQIPKLVQELCSYISCSLETEGLFRKAGSTARQKEIKLLLDAGCELSSEHHVIDVANVLKLFLRELPEPLIPYPFHDTFLQCLIAKKGEVLNALLLTCLLLPAIHLTTLIYYMEFLQRVTAYSNYNRMDVKNIAIVMTPTVMPIEDKVISYSTQRLSHHVQVIQILLENAEKIGVLPVPIVESLHLPKLNNSNEENKKKKKRRSGSLTRMFHGLKKIVSTKSIDENNKQINSATPDLLLTPCITRSAKKRKVMQISGFSNKRRRELLETLPQASALVNTPFKPLSTPVCHHPKPEDVQATPLHDSDFVRIPKSEYEEIKSRVSAIEDRLSQELNNVAAMKDGISQELNSATDVQTAYEKTLEEVESLSSPGTEQLAKRLSRELKIRRSAEHKVIRSPSARKIGSIRRRSQEVGRVSRNQSCHIPRVTLKRGRPNTVMSGLPMLSPMKASNIGRSSSFHSQTPNASDTASQLEKWTSAEFFFSKLKRQTLDASEQNRDSLVKLRAQNAGMVLTRAKLFNDLSDNSDSNRSLDKPIEKRTRRGAVLPRRRSSEKENDVPGRNHFAKSPRRVKPVKVFRQ